MKRRAVLLSAAASLVPRSITPALQIEELIGARALAIRAGDLAEALRLSERLEAFGVILRYVPEGTYWVRA